MQNAVVEQVPVTSPDTSVQLMNLAKFANYTISVVAFTVAQGDESEAVTVRTLEDSK